MWPRKRRQLHVADPLGAGERGLANCPAMRPTFTTGTPGRVGQHHRHLQDDLELVPDGVGAELGEGLGAVAGLEEEGLAVGHLGEVPGQLAGLAGEDQRRQRGQPGLGPLERVGVGPLRLLGRGELPPGRGAPRGSRSGARHRTRLTP